MSTQSNHEIAFGFSLFAPASGLSPQTLRSAGHFKHASRYESPRARDLIQQRLVADAYGMLHMCGYGDTPCGIHLRKVASTPADSWQEHHRDVAKIVSDVLVEARVHSRSAALHKHAFTPSDVSEALLNATKTGALLALLTGVPLGAGYFAMDRAFGDDSVALKKKEQELMHFRRVGEKLQQRLASKYSYRPEESATAYSPQEAAYV